MTTTSLQRNVKLKPLLDLSVGSAIGQLRAIPVRMGPGEPRAILVAYAADFDVGGRKGVGFT